MKKKIVLFKIVILCLIFFLYSVMINADEEGKSFKKIEGFIGKIMKKAKIPGISLIIVKGDNTRYLKGFGYADLKEKIEVTPETKFELASCSKSFTALGALQLEKKGLINLDDPVSYFLPGFYLSFEKQKYEVTIRQLLHHAGGISKNTIALISPDDSDEALQKTVQKLIGIELDSAPGKEFQYATVNYDIIGAVIEKVTRQSFEEYMRDNVFIPLGLHKTTVGVKKDIPLMAAGYKIGFFAPRKYVPPVYRGNNPAGYIISNGEDIARWLSIQMGLVKTGLNDLIQKTHMPDLTMPLMSKDLRFYSKGWIVNKLRGEISHLGANPNFTAYISFKPEERIGVAVLANSNSRYIPVIGDYLMKIMSGEQTGEFKEPEDKIDTTCSIVSIFLGIFLIFMSIYIIIKTTGIFRGRKKIGPLTLKKVIQMVGTILLGIPIFFGIYILPEAMAKISWEIILVWGPLSIPVLLILLIAFFSLSYVIYFLSLLFPDQNKYRNIVPLVMFLNIISSLSGLILMPIIVGSFVSTISLGYLLFYFGLTLGVATLSTKIARMKMIHLTNNLTLDMRVDLIRKILSTKYQKFEKLLDGQIFTTLNNDIRTMSGSVRLFMGFVSNSIVVIAGLLYLSSVSMTAALIVIACAILIAVYYVFVSKKAKVYLEEARTAQNVYMSFINSFINGFKELSLRLKKKIEFKKDLVGSCDEIRKKTIIANVKFLNTEIIVGFLATMVIGLFCILTPRLLSNVNMFVLMSLVMVILYLRAPFTALIGIMPQITGIRVAWGRIKQFNEAIDNSEQHYSFLKFFKDIDLPGSKNLIALESIADHEPELIENLKVDGLMFKYNSRNVEEQFEVGPINFEVSKGEILFITGGNGSGKTTLIKLLSGLYKPDRGKIIIDGKEIKHDQLGEYYSAVFSDYHLFKKLYTIDVANKMNEIRDYFKTLQLEYKVQIEGDSFSTINLSGGQRKRLALLVCYLENRPIYLFDELAADQDPGFRNFIYRDMFPRMKEEGKIVIACTHDDHYFDTADKVIKMDMGNIEFIENGYGDRQGQKRLSNPGFEKTIKRYSVNKKK